MIKERHPQRRRGYDTWTDTPDRPLRQQLGEVFTHIERWADQLIEQREQERRRERQRLRDRDQREASARRAFAEDHRRTTIAARIDEQRFSDDARANSAALLAVADDLPPDRAADVRAWALWIGEHADRVDPRTTGQGMPQTPRPSRDDLRPYLPPGHWY